MHRWRKCSKQKVATLDTFERCFDFGEVCVPDKISLLYLLSIDTESASPTTIYFGARKIAKQAKMPEENCMKTAFAQALTSPALVC